MSQLAQKISELLEPHSLSEELKYVSTPRHLAVGCTAIAPNRLQTKLSERKLVLDEKYLFKLFLLMITSCDRRREYFNKRNDPQGILYMHAGE